MYQEAMLPLPASLLTRRSLQNNNTQSCKTASLSLSAC